jgi:hypothetical protein
LQSAGQIAKEFPDLFFADIKKAAIAAFFFEPLVLVGSYHHIGDHNGLITLFEIEKE